MRTQYELAETTLALRWSAPSVGAAVRDACEQLGLPRASRDAHPSLVLALRTATGCGPGRSGAARSLSVALPAGSGGR